MMGKNDSFTKQYIEPIGNATHKIGIDFLTLNVCRGDGKGEKELVLQGLYYMMICRFLHMDISNNSFYVCVLFGLWALTWKADAVLISHRC